METNYYVDIIEKIKQDIKNKNWDHAQFLIDIELEAPYIPSEVELELNNLLSLIRQENVDHKKTSLITIEEFEEKILSEKKEERLFCLSQLESLNAKNFTEFFKRFFINDEFDNDEKTLLLLSLNRQNINIDFKIKKFNQLIKINPSEFKFNNYINLFKETEFIFSKLSDNNDVTFSKYFSDLLMEFINEYIPFEISFNCWEIAIAIMYIVNKLMTNDYNYKQICFDYEVSEKNVDKIILILNNKINKE